MQAAPRRLARRTANSAPSSLVAPDLPNVELPAAAASARIGTPPMADRATHKLPPTRRLWRRFRVIRRGVVILGWTLFAGLIQSLMLALPGRGKARFARFYWAANCRLMGVAVRTIGTQAAGHGRPVIYASNHSSWLDVPVLGGTLSACFVAKEDVGSWPVVGQVARLGRTIFVSRQRGTTGRERDDMRLRLAAGDDLILFPEGTSSDGTGVLPFRSSFFAAAKPSNGTEAAAASPQPLVQPVSIVYDRLAGLPVGNARRAVFAWYGDMDLASHFWQLAQWRSMRASIWLHPPLDPADFPTRKALAQASWDAVAYGAAQLRQNRLGDKPAPCAAPAQPVPPTRIQAHQPTTRPGCVSESSLDKHRPSFA